VLDAPAMFGFFDGSFAAAAAVSVAAGVVRGFTGFGSAMLMAPPLSALYTPAIAIPMITVMELGVGLTLLPRAVPVAKWPTVLRLAAAALLGIPAGAALLVTVPGMYMRWAISAAIILAVVLLALGIGRKGEATPAGTYATGALSGLTSGAVGMGGPPVVIYYLAGRDPAAEIRASLICFFVATAVIQTVTYALNGILTADNGVKGLILLPSFVIGSVVGARLFRNSREQVYRKAAMGLVTVVAVLSLTV